MKTTLITFSLIIFLAANTGLNAQGFPEKYFPYGNVYITTLRNSAYPSAERLNGIIKGDKEYTYEENYSDSSVIVFIPKKLESTEIVNFVFFFYGWMNSNYYTASTTDLIMQFINSKKNAVLVFPAMAKFAPDSFEGNFKNTGVFNKYVAELTDSLFEHSYIKSYSAGKIILCGHSGGYRPIISVLKNGEVEENIAEIYLLDGLYGEVNVIFNWIKNTNGRIINVSTQNSSPLKNSGNLMRKLDKAGLQYISSAEEDFQFAQYEVKGSIFLETTVNHGAVLEKNLCRYLMMSSLNDISP
ncbi:MAG TPA: hypothetical protein VIK14_13355 [Ignavibacteria bacterium]